ncbi:hypothetical protein B566_EDAN012075, partial [Ephemera danica]
MIVGAPFYSDVEDEGRRQLLRPSGSPDVAVAAPYEGAGVVYIYRGGRDGLSNEPTQRIVGAEVSPGLSGFGASLSRGQDVDGNGYL